MIVRTFIRATAIAIGRPQSSPSSLSSSLLSSCSSSSSRPLSSSQRRINGDTHTAPWWSIASLQGKVASMIVNALPENHPLKTKSIPSPSINEAIVSARARDEALQQQQRSTSSIDDTKKLEVEIEARVYEKAKEKMELELRAMETKFKLREEERIRNEKMERERMETELRRELSYEKWKEDVAKEKMEQRQKEGESNVATTQKGGEQVHGEVVMTNLIEEQGGGGMEIGTNRDDDQLLYPIHPILGPQIAILPYKRVHLTPASILASIPVYERQRAYRHDRALTMAKDKRKTLWMGIPGVISLMEDDDGRLSILDGQHRVGMMALLAEERRKKQEKGSTGRSDDGDDLDTLDLDNILVEVYISSGNDIEDDMAAAIFTEINKAEPVKLLDLPGVTTKRTRDIIDHAASHFADTYPAMFSTSARCRAPHLNLDNLRDSLFASNVIQREKFGSGGELVKWMLLRNDELRELYGGDGSVSETNDGSDNASEAAEVDGKISMNDTVVKKARKYDFYLGLESSWLYKK